MRKHEYLACPYCEGRMIWQTTEMACERIDEYAQTDTACVDYYVCDTCGRDYEIIEPKEEERAQKYNAYWHEIK